MYCPICPFFIFFHPTLNTENFHFQGRSALKFCVEILGDFASSMFDVGRLHDPGTSSSSFGGVAGHGLSWNIHLEYPDPRRGASRRPAGHGRSPGVTFGTCVAHGQLMCGSLTLIVLRLYLDCTYWGL